MRHKFCHISHVDDSPLSQKLLFTQISKLYRFSWMSWISNFLPLEWEHWETMSYLVCWNELMNHYLSKAVLIQIALWSTFLSDSWTFVNIVRVEWSNPWWFRFVYLTLMENTNSFENNFEHARTFMNIHEHPRANITVQAKIEPIRLVSIHIFIQIRKFDAWRSVPR